MAALSDLVRGGLRSIAASRTAVVIVAVVFTATGFVGCEGGDLLDADCVEGVLTGELGRVIDMDGGKQLELVAHYVTKDGGEGVAGLEISFGFVWERSSIMRGVALTDATGSATFRYSSELVETDVRSWGAFQSYLLRHRSIRPGSDKVHYCSAEAKGELPREQLPQPQPPPGASPGN